MMSLGLTQNDDYVDHKKFPYKLMLPQDPDYPIDLIIQHEKDPMILEEL